VDILQFLLSAEQAGSYVEKTLIAAIVADPSDTTAIAAYGDYLEEHARTLAAMVVRSPRFAKGIELAVRAMGPEIVPQAVATGFIPPRTGSVVSGMFRSGAGYLVPLASGLIGGGSEMGCLTQEQNQQRLSAFFRDILPQKKDNQ
jgi:uncharacterized protein (TIGR02996 family)